MSDKAKQEHFHKEVAAQANNRGWDLIERDALSNEEKLKLVTVASTARYHWHLVGDASNKAHADLLFAWALARVAGGPVAVDVARSALDYFENADGLPWEKAFAHAAMAAAQIGNGSQEGFDKHYSIAAEIGATLKPEGKVIFDAAFKTLVER